MALKWVLPEPDSDRALGIVGRAYALRAPELLAIECANALWLRVRRRELTPVEARTAYADLLAVPIAWASDRSLAPATLALGLTWIIRPTTAPISRWPWRRPPPS